MTPEQLEQIKTLLLRAKDLPSEQRTAFLDAACAGDAEMRAELERLFAEEDPEATLETLAKEIAVIRRAAPGSEDTPQAHDAQALPDRIGPYRILSVLGEGGMGTIYLAEQTKPVRRRVALKIIKLGMDTKQVIARFEAERQALALMDHPNVARIFDAGATEQGRPYFVMEHVAGVPITDHCDRHKVGIQERLDLFIQVCEAVQHAHQKGVIHRDIKPSNILVSFKDDKAVPKIIDFGVAKALNQRLTEKTIFTEQGQLVGTPEYMSPEQAERTSQDIDTRSDVYSLGVLLYELLTGVLPFDRRSLRSAAFDEIVRIIREVEPQKPSTKLSTLLTSGSEASAIAARNRHTDPSTLVRAMRGDLDWITMKCLEKDRTRRYAGAAELASDLRRYLSDEPVLAGPPGALYRARKFVRRNRGPLVGLCASLVGITLLTIFAIGWFVAQKEADRVDARIQLNRAKLVAHRDPGTALMMLDAAIAADGNLIEAKIERAFLLKRRRQHTEAIAAAEAILAQHPERGEAHVLLAELYRSSDPKRAARHRAEGRRLLPETHYCHALALDPDQKEEAIRLLTASLDDYPWNFDALLHRAVRYHDVEDYEKTYEDAQLLVKVAREQAAAWGLLGSALVELSRPEEAIECLNKAVDLDKKYWLWYFDRACAFLDSEEYERALDDCDQAIALNRRDAGTHALRASVRYEMGRSEQALTDCDSALSLDPKNALAYRIQGKILFYDTDEKDKALLAFNQAIQLDPSGTDAYFDRGYLHQQSERYQEAINDITKAIDLGFKNVYDRVNAVSVRGAAYFSRQEFNRARDDFEQAIELDPQFSDTYHNLGRVFLVQGRYSQALAAFQEEVDAVAAIEGLEIPQVTLGRGIARWFTGDERGALEDFVLAASRDPLDIALAWLWVWEIRMSRGEKDAADQALENARIGLQSADDPEAVAWPLAILGLHDDSMSPSALIDQALTDGLRCEAYYYIGALALYQDRLDEARSSFQRCLHTDAVNYFEYILARQHLQKLTKD